MIDKNDVKMPVQKESVQKYQDAEFVQKVEDLLELVNESESKQELRLKADYYARFHWFGESAIKNDRSFFSYQEEAVYDFLFSLNKSGILSDQVGMGKTIEAGMIISELASRNELRSLLIIVPNEIMAAKWEYELEYKFGIKKTEFDNNGVIETFPGVKAIKNFDDFCQSLFSCVSREKFAELAQHKFDHSKYVPTEQDTLAGIMRRFVESDIKTAVELINNGFEVNEMEGDPEIVFDGKRFAIKNTKFFRDYVYDAEGKIANYIKSFTCRSAADIQSVIKNNRFVRTYRDLIETELKNLYALIGHYITTFPSEITQVAGSMTSSDNFPIMVIPIHYTDPTKNDGTLVEFLNKQLLPKMENHKHTYIEQDQNGVINEVVEDYRIIDFFVDVGYQMMIVDEVHDYIDVCAKVEREQFHNDNSYLVKYPSSDYNRFELFDDYYFIKKNSLYKKLKSLADNANRKIFLTATPIKSDMVDFYLLTLLASNKDSEAYKKASEALMQDFPTDEARDKAIRGLYNSFKSCVMQVSAQYFCDYSDMFFELENEDDRGSSTVIKSSRCKYPYFNNAFLRHNVNRPEKIKQYILSQMSYMTMEEIVLELILAYNAEQKDSANIGAIDTIRKLETLLGDEGSNLQTRVVFRSLLNNTVKIRFEEDFTKDDGQFIKRIRELLELEDGPRKWHKTYRKYGIRHTRHQTYNLENCESIEYLSDNRKERYRNLPTWPRRNGKVIFLLRDDVFFDNFLEVRRDREEFEEEEIRITDLPNYDPATDRIEKKKVPFQHALSIFNFVNDSMSGGDPETHDPQNSKYEAIELDDAHLVDYKLAMVNKLMLSSDSNLGSIRNKVLLFAENDREEILEWFRYQKCAPLYNPETDGELDPQKLAEYQAKWNNYKAGNVQGSWSVTDKADDMERIKGNLLVIIDPKRYEKGVDLQKADTIINFDINYDPLKMEQRIGRIDRIRPAGKSNDIHIISFVPYNDMSGYVINFFANELKMFTQWMGETTGIVSVPEDAGMNGDGGEDVSFEGKVYNLERYYTDLYRLCREDVSNAELDTMVKNFAKNFCTPDTDLTEDEVRIDYGMIRALRASFDKAFRNSMSPVRSGYQVRESADRIMRFNTTMNVLQSTCSAATCKGCPNFESCKSAGSKKHNVFGEFRSALDTFFQTGAKYFADKVVEIEAENRSRKIGQENEELLQRIKRKKEEFGRVLTAVRQSLPAETNDPFTVPFDKFNDNVFLPMKKLYWDDVVGKYISIILKGFHKQCDSVLQSAKLFEKFIKTLSIADFMNNMEGKA